MEKYNSLKKEDYAETACLICDPTTGKRISSSSIPIRRIVEKLDEYCDRKDFAAAERHLAYWLEDARSSGDIQGEFSLRNEMMGYYRKQGLRDKAMENASAALDLMQRLAIENSISGATCYINCATVYENFAMPEKAIIYFEKAGAILENSEHKDLYKLGGLYNNMALALTDLQRYEQAMDCYSKALDVMKEVENGELEQAITYMNMADAAAIWKGFDDAAPLIDSYLNTAAALLDSKHLPRDGYYAFVCEKCAPGFNCYGYFKEAEHFSKKAEEIYQQIGENK